MLSRLERVEASLRLTLAKTGQRTQPARVYETGGWRLKFPRGPACEAVIVNTGGGMAGGDRVSVEINLQAGAEALVTSQSQEKIYRAEGEPAILTTSLTLAPAARLVFAPQETLLFDRARLERRLDAEVGQGACLTVLEAVVFGRLASGESHARAALSDRWRIKREGKLVFAEAFAIEDAGTTLDRPALGHGARAMATLVRLAPDVAAQLTPLRDALAAVEAQGGFEAGASVVDGVLVARACATSPARLREGLVAALAVLEGRAAPRVWW